MLFQKEYVISNYERKILQMAVWKSDQFVVLLKQGNACGGKGLTEVRVT
jgi:hypothetical protein